MGDVKSRYRCCEGGKMTPGCYHEGCTGASISDAKVNPYSKSQMDGWLEWERENKVEEDE